MVIILELLVHCLCIYKINPLFLHINKLEQREHGMLKMFLTVNVKLFAIQNFTPFRYYRK